MLFHRFIELTGIEIFLDEVKEKYLAFPDLLAGKIVWSVAKNISRFKTIQVLKISLDGKRQGFRV
jgi:hypothetical protein